MFHVVFYILSVNLYVSCSGSITSVGEERCNLSVLFTRNYVVYVRRGFLFLLVLRVGYFILLWHSWAFHIIGLFISITNKNGGPHHKTNKMTHVTNQVSDKTRDSLCPITVIAGRTKNLFTN